MLRPPKPSLLKNFWERLVDWIMPQPIMPMFPGDRIPLRYCEEHGIYDGCIHRCGCNGTCTAHKNKGFTSSYEVKPLPGLSNYNIDTHSHVREPIVRSTPDHSWAKIPVPKGNDYVFKCKCTCHERYGGHTTCASWCCKKLREAAVSEGLITKDSDCLCLCHDQKSVACEGTITCCDISCGPGETDQDLGDTHNSKQWPWNAGLTTRLWNKKNMSDTMHLNMTLEGKAEAIDLFHCILAKVDEDYPRQPMMKVTDTIPICSGCKGLVWKNMCLTPEELHKAAKDASEAAGTPVMIKVHRWWKGKKCNKKFKNAKVELVALETRVTTA